MYKVNISLTKESFIAFKIDKGDIIKNNILGPLIQLVLCPVGIHVGVGPQGPSPGRLPSPRRAPDY